MASEPGRVMKRRAVLVLLAFGYFVAFPEDLPAALAPVERLLSLTNAVSPWVYGVVVAVVLSRALVRPFARTPGVREHGEG